MVQRRRDVFLQTPDLMQSCALARPQSLHHLKLYLYGPWHVGLHRIIHEQGASQASCPHHAGAQAASSSNTSHTVAGTSASSTDLPATSAHPTRAASPNPGLMLAMQRKRAVRALRSLAASAHLPWPSPPVSGAVYRQDLSPGPTR